MTPTLCIQSLALAGLATVASVFLGATFALWVAGLERTRRRRTLLVAAAALVMPPFLVTNCWLDLFAENAPWHLWLPFRLYSLGGAIWLLSLISWPVTTFLLLGAWDSLSPVYLEAETELHGFALWRGLLWPMGRGAIGQAALITFVLALNHFTVPVLLQIRVLPEAMWLKLSTELDDRGALLASAPLIVAPLLLLVLFRRRSVSWPVLGEPASAKLLAARIGPLGRWSCGALAWALALLAVALPLARLVAQERTWTELPNILRTSFGSIGNSVLLAMATATLAIGAGALCRNAVAGPLLWVPFLVPGVLVGRAAGWALSATELRGSAWPVVLAFTVRYAAVGCAGVRLAMRLADRDLVDTARLSGARGWAVFRHGYWPQSGPALLATWYVIYLLSLWDVESMILIQPPGGETLAIRIFNLLHYGHNAQVNGLCLVLLAVALGPLAGARWSRGRDA